MHTDTPVINCAWCGEPTLKTNWRKKFCSRKCADLGKPGSQGTCAGCGEPMRLGAGSLPNGEAMHAKCRPWHTGHKDKCGCQQCRTFIAAKHAEYRERYKDEHGCNPSTPARRRRRKNGTYSGYRQGIPGSIREAAYLRDAGVCQICGAPTDIDGYYNSDWYPSLDHVTPRSQGGTDTLDNLRTVHRYCNNIRRDNIRTDEEVKAMALIALHA